MSEHLLRQDSSLPHQHDVQAPSEAQLRYIYDEEEIERFLSLFSTYVTEIRISTSAADTGSIKSHILGNLDTATGRHPTPCLADRSISEYIAYNYLFPYLPSAADVTPTFTLKRLSLIIQRLYLALFPPYKAFLLDIAQLALWKDYQRSLRHCITFWFLWYHDLLLPALLFRIIFGLLRRRSSNYPTLKEVQERRQETARALKFGEAVQQRLSVTTLGPIELWRLFKLYRSDEKSQAKPSLKDETDTDDDVVKRDTLHALHELADLHERIKNIFTWRRPDVSHRYLLFFIAVGFSALLLPAQYISKLVYSFWGILFWHVTPIIAALPRGDRIRLMSLLFGDAPTDADYAMELIAKRIATGQDIDTASLRNQTRHTSHTPASMDILTPTLSGNSHKVQSFEDDRINWKKWGGRVARGKAFLEEGRQFLSTHTSRNPIQGETASSHHSGADDEQTFLAEYASSPGLITLTPSILFFTPLTGTHARLVMPRDRLRGVKKSGLVKGISITWTPEGLIDGEEREEKFHWVGNRDELFARLVGPVGRRWITHDGLSWLRGWFRLVLLSTFDSSLNDSTTTASDLFPRSLYIPKLASRTLTSSEHSETAMFFSPDLLSKRDSGFGLLWLAATLGSKSAFKKLPKRSVMTADIAQLCRLIATPAEPLALRLSSNLLVGAARVYRVKQEIFMSDVTTCFNSLKRVEHEFRSMTSSEGQLQMAQPSVKPSAVTLRVDPSAAFSIEFDAMITNWDEYLNFGSNKDVEGDSDNDYHPMTMKAKGKVKASSTLPPNAEFLRATACTLPEDPDFLLVNSFNASFGGSGTTMLSSQIGGLGFDDTFDGLDIGEGVGDDLVRELGEGWGASSFEESPAESFTQVQEPFGMNFDTGYLDDGTPIALDEFVQVVQDLQPHCLANSIQDSQIKSVDSHPSPSLAGTTKSVDFGAVTHSSHSPPVELVVQHTYKVPTQPENNGAMSRKAKRARLVLDVRTELTDEELKATRMYYLDKQNTIRHELELKRFEKKRDDLIHSLLWDAPGSVHAKELVDFWVDHFKAHVAARSGLFIEPQHLGGPPRQKRRKISFPPSKAYMGDIEDILAADNWHTDQEAVAPIDGGDITDFNYNANVNWGVVDDCTPDAKNLRSSEEPGQARRASHPPPAFGDNLGLDVVSDNFHSQRSALFPWDMAGASSSISAREGGTQVPSSDWMSVEHADARLRGSSASRRGSSLPSVPNLQAGMGSPAMILSTLQSDNDFAFDVPGGNYARESRQSEANRVTLEKNSYNFLEYAKMQYKSLPSAQHLVFDDVVPKASSTARVAAAALYYCLVLATKDLLLVNQQEPYGQIDIRIK